MKKLFLFVFLAIFGFTNAQEVSFGVKAGANLANLIGDVMNPAFEIEDGGEIRTSFHIGVVAEIPLAQDFFFAPELLYSSQGAKSTLEGAFENFSFKGEMDWKLDYIQLPLMARYYVADNFSLEAGPQVGFLIAATQNWEYSETGEGSNISVSESDDVKDMRSNLDFGLNIGLSYKLVNGLFFQGRYNLGLTNVYDFEGDDDFSAQNSVIQVSVGFMF